MYFQPIVTSIYYQGKRWLLSCITIVWQENFVNSNGDKLVNGMKCPFTPVPFCPQDTTMSMKKMDSHTVTKSMNLNWNRNTIRQCGDIYAWLGNKYRQCVVATECVLLYDRMPTIVHTKPNEFHKDTELLFTQSPSSVGKKEVIIATVLYNSRCRQD